MSNKSLSTARGRDGGTKHVGASPSHSSEAVKQNKKGSACASLPGKRREKHSASTDEARAASMKKLVEAYMEKKFLSKFAPKRTKTARMRCTKSQQHERHRQQLKIRQRKAGTRDSLNSSGDDPSRVQGAGCCPGKGQMNQRHVHQVCSAALAELRFF
ncbi:hypothetical protein TGARI_223685 [Toxoplasma gondii ARI]|uniref:Uncharacterized protein n=1 Tax=Toxoplasma gondii ARI TaxID=1074872 RepID=A0A139XTX5_TOXGO|nr:hypothetical protein TGARI_223685 [Toxoplasma gondii ARI]